MNKIVSIKKTSAIFLAIVLVAGTIAVSSPSFMAGAQAQPYYGMDDRYDSYEPTEYPPEYTDNNRYEPSYETDSYKTTSYENDNNYEPREYSSYPQDYKREYQSYDKDNNYKSKDSSVNVKKVKCNNINLNLNGINIGDGGNTTTNGGSDGDSLGAASLAANGDSDGGYGERNNKYADKKDGFVFVCINNNNNLVTGGGGNVTDGNGNVPDTCEECFTTILTEDELTILILGTTVFTTLEELCNFIDTTFENESQREFISEYIFNAASGLNIPVEKIEAIFDCLEEIYGVDFPGPD